MASETWWREGVLYQIYPRSFADSNGDGVGDLQGLIGRLDHLEWLGVDGIWLNPTMPSPNDDWGYDVSDYCGVHPELGTLEDLDALVAAAGERGIRVLLDLVPNHTSSEHAWFVDALSGRDAEFRDYYVWADPVPGGGPPNNWESNFGGSAWQWHEPTGQYYLNNFLPTQPDLNWWNEDVRVAFDDVLRFWFDRGIAGFRIDVCHAIVKDRELRDDPAVTPDDHPEVRRRAVKQVFSMNRPEVHDVLRRWRGVADGHDPRAILVGETYVLNLDSLMPYYGNGEDELNLAFNFLFVHADLDADELRRIVAGVEEKLPAERLARLHGLQPRRGALHHALGRRRPAQVAPRAADADDAPRHAVPLLRRRARPARGGDGLADGAGPGRQAHRRPVAQPRPLPDADAVERGARRRVHGGRRDAVAAVRRPRGAQRRRPGRRPRLPAVAHARPDRAAARGGGAADGRLRRARRAGRRLGLAARRRVRDGAEPVRRAGRGGRPLRDGRDRDGPRARRRGGRRRDRARAVGGGARPHGVSALEPLLSEEGWAYASLPPQEPGDPGRFHALFGRDSLITALQVLPAAPEVARATLRALAARQGRVDDPEVDEQPGKILHEYRPVAEPRFAELGWPVRDGGLLYYGSADATSWFLVVLGALGDAALARELEPAWRAAAGWLAAALDEAAGW